MAAGLLDIALTRDGVGRTRIAELIQYFPQHITAPMYLDEEDPSRAHLCIQNACAGIFPGDRLRTKIRAGVGATVSVTTQAATQVFGPHQDSGNIGASNDLEFIVEDGAVVEYFPKTVIPHRDSTLYEAIQVDIVGDDGIFIGWSALASGRIGHGERASYRLYNSRTNINRRGKTVVRDRLMLQPARQVLSDPGLLHGRDYLGTLIVIGPGDVADRLIAAVRAAEFDRTHCGASQLPFESGAMVRLLADSEAQLVAALTSLRAAVTASMAEHARCGHTSATGIGV